jgi:hemerythrin
MDHFIWKDSFAIGIQELDDQHKMFIDYVNECYNAVHHDKTRQVTDATIYDLKVYADNHFQFEQSVMQEVGYPGLTEQLNEHAYFVKQVAEVERALLEGRKSTVESMLLFLREWFLTHIMDHDRKLAAYLASSKVKPGRLKSIQRT